MPSYTDPDSETVFQNEDMAELFILGCYRGLIHQEMYYHLGMGETVMHSSEDGSTNNSKYRICNYSYDPMVPATVTTIFKEGYRIIESTNLAISKLKKMSETTKRNALLGEALSIRAFCYLNLIRIYGDVPAVWTPMEELDPNDENVHRVMKYMIRSSQICSKLRTGYLGLKKVDMLRQNVCLNKVSMPCWLVRLFMQVVTHYVGICRRMILPV